jgi:hydroxymethylbilane synthase
MKPLRLATRGSALALWQARFVADQLEVLGVPSELVVIQTQGDLSVKPFAELTGQGFFTKAIQEALLESRADIAVHSYKDLPSAQIPGLQIAAVPIRADPRDVLLALPTALDASRRLGLKAGASVGTSAVRRRAQVQSLDPSLNVQDMRGTVPTRVKKLRSGQYDAIILAAAGLERLGLSLAGLEVRSLEPDFFVPAPAQGALALECRSDAPSIQGLLQKLECPEATQTVTVERNLMARFSGGCQLALGALAQPGANGLSLLAWYGGFVFERHDHNATALVEGMYAQIRKTCPEGPA